MTATRILDGLERVTATGKEADSVARLGFLEWVFLQPGDATAKAAREALNCPAARNAGSAAARAFVDFLRQATLPVSRPGRRGGRLRRVH